MFMRGASGLVEDPATGSATVAAAALLADLDPTRDGELKLTVGQGFDMGRPSILPDARAQAGGQRSSSAHVGGSCVQMMEGTFRAGGRGVGLSSSRMSRGDHTCRPAKFLTATPSRSSMISAIIWRWQWV